MNRRQLLKLGVPERCIKAAIACIERGVSSGAIRGKQVKLRVREVVATPKLFVGDPHFSELAQSLIEAANVTPLKPISYRTWGDQIDPAAHQQMENACHVPGATGAALMPDAHVGYGLPIGGVLACEGRVIPYAVGVDIACRMKLSVLDLPPETITKQREQCCVALEQGTVFGVGAGHQRRQEHDVMDRDWTVSRVTRENRDKAWRQLGSSGSGNHFVEFGVLTLAEAELGLEAGEYLALLSHSGSRGAGAAVCSTYSSIARRQLPPDYEPLGRLAWLEMNSQEGQEYWAAMNLMGEYASANHAVIHRNVVRLLGGEVIAGVENHHNFAWLEKHGGREVVVHRKGATPAAAGVLGVIPGSMADPAFVVRGKGNPESLDSASHGAGRRMSRTTAKATYNYRAVKNELAKRGVQLLSAGADEVPGVYKNIIEVMQQQRDLVEAVARFDPRIVKMCGDGSRAED